MDLTGQDLIAFAIVLAATSYLVRRMWAVVAAKKKPGCSSGCSSCPASANRQPEKQLVSLEDLKLPASR